MLIQRTLSGIGYVATILAVLFLFREAAFTLFALGLILGCFWEWLNLLKITDWLRRSASILIFLLGMAIMLVFPMLAHGVIYLSFALWLGIILLLCMTQYQKQLPVIPLWVQYILGFILLWAAYGALVLTRTAAQGAEHVLLLFLIVWCSDTYAYSVGRLCGKHRLAPVLSPKKTWQGLIGAMILTIPSIALYYHFVLHQPFALSAAIGVALAVLISASGDLFESLLKRLSGVKDSGIFLPGHGGFLDRLDSLLALAPYWLCISTWGWV